jgi:Ca2+-binding EF-hand superfamily protein
MKLAALALLTTLGLGGVAGADPARPAERPRGQLHQLLLERFDRNHDGRLDPQERRHAIRALRRLARRMELQDGRAERGARREARMRELVRRYDRNGDGVVSPDEMPPGLARRLQRLDRNGDGWLDERDQP